MSCNPAPHRTSRSGGACTWPRWCCRGCPRAHHTRSSRGGGQSPARAPREGVPPGGGVPARPRLSRDGSFAAASPAVGQGRLEGVIWRPASSPSPGRPDCCPSSFPSLGPAEQMGKRGKLASSSKVPAGKTGPSPSSCLEARTFRWAHPFPQRPQGQWGHTGRCSTVQTQVPSLPSHRPPASPLPCISSTG